MLVDTNKLEFPLVMQYLVVIGIHQYILYVNKKLAYIYNQNVSNSVIHDEIRKFAMYGLYLNELTIK